jgi:PAS domain-containing protein
LLNQPFYEADANGYAFFFNEALLTVLGLDMDSAIGYGWLKAVSEADARRVQEEWEYHIKHNMLRFDTTYRVKKDGKMYRSVAIILRDEQKEIKYIFGTVNLQLTAV